MEMLEIGLLAVLAVCVAQALRLLPKKMIPLNRRQATALALIIAVVGVGMYDWAGLRTGALGIREGGLTGEPQVTTGVTFQAEGSETDTNLSYDAAGRTFTCSYYENQCVLDNIVQPTTANAAGITTVTFTVTVFRTDLLALSENSVTKAWIEVPKFYGKSGTENESNQYAAIARATDDKWNVTVTPAGVSARNEYNYFTVGSGGSRAIVFVATISNRGLSQLDNFQSSTCAVHIYGLTEVFYLRFTKTGEVRIA